MLWNEYVGPEDKNNLMIKGGFWEIDRQFRLLDKHVHLFLNYRYPHAMLR